MVKKIQVNMSNKLFYTFVTIGLMILSVILVYAYGGSNPAVHGHSVGELGLGVYDCGEKAITKIDFDTGELVCRDVTGVTSVQFDLVYGIHSSEQCTNLGGTVVSDGEDKMCKFNGASCQPGWSQFKDWSTTASGSCLNPRASCPGTESGSCACDVDYYHSFWGNYGVLCPGLYPTLLNYRNEDIKTQYHSWSNSPVDICEYLKNECASCYSAVGSTYLSGCSKATCTATRTQAGCY